MSKPERTPGSSPGGLPTQGRSSRPRVATSESWLVRPGRDADPAALPSDLGDVSDPDVAPTEPYTLADQEEHVRTESSTVNPAPPTAKPVSPFDANEIQTVKLPVVDMSYEETGRLNIVRMPFEPPPRAVHPLRALIAVLQILFLSVVTAAAMAALILLTRASAPISP